VAFVFKNCPVAKYTYMRRCEDLPDDFDRIVVKAIFTAEGNNFIVTAWPDYLERE